MLINNEFLTHSFQNLCEMHPKLNGFLRDISIEGDILLFGGAVRDLGFYQTFPRDLDVIINSNSLNLDSYFSGLTYRKNRFGGYKLVLDNINIDIWSLPLTWAFRMGILIPDVRNLVKSVFLNFDALVYDITKKELWDGGFSKAIRSNTLDIVLSQNPYPALNVLRTLVFIEKYGFNLSNQLQNFMRSWFDIEKQEGVKKLLKMQEMHYGTMIITKKQIKNYISFIKSK